MKEKKIIIILICIIIVIISGFTCYNINTTNNKMLILNENKINYALCEASFININIRN